MLGVTDSVADYRIPEGDRMTVHWKLSQRRDDLCGGRKCVVS